MIAIDPPSNSITTSQVFSSDLNAIAATASIYSDLINNNFGFANGGMTLYAGLSADELMLFNLNPDDDYGQFQTNSLNAANYQIYGSLWGQPYSAIYKANALIEGLQGYSGVTDSVKNELIGEAEFVRALCNFYLVNLFDGVPEVRTINFSETSLLPRLSPGAKYNQIIADLNDAKNRLSADFSVGKGQRIIPNRGAATALLSRAYLYVNDYAKAVEQSTELINQQNLYRLVSIRDIFLKNSPEAIWQLQQDNTGLSIAYNATYEGFRFIPSSPTANPFVVLRSSTVQSFRMEDLRRSWIDSATYRNTKYYFPSKYKVGAAQAVPNGNITEYYMVFRLAEQYLIRAEAYLNLNRLSDAIADINVIRARAGLAPLSQNIPADSLRQVVEDERRYELIAEWGHRWLDLKRTKRASTVLGSMKAPYWRETAVLYPIPQAEIQRDPNLTQNPGY